MIHCSTHVFVSVKGSVNFNKVSKSWNFVCTNLYETSPFSRLAFAYHNIKRGEHLVYPLLKVEKK